MVKNNIGNVITHNPTGLIKPWDFFISHFKVIIHYLWMFIWPFNISVEYDWVLCRSFFGPDCLLPLVVLGSIFYGIIKLLRTNRAHPLAFGLIWFFACIAPRSSIIPSPELLVDYKTYTASFGWLFVLACALVALCFMLVRYLHKNAPKLNTLWVCLVYTLILTLGLGFATRSRNKIWSSGMDFWNNMIQNAPKKARAYNNYGVELSLKLGKYKESIPYFKKAIAMDAHYPDPCNNLAVAYASLNRIDDAIQAMKDGLRINPYYPEGYNNLAHMFIQKKEFDTAEKNLRTALQMRPYYGKAYYNMARIRLEQNKPEEAWAFLKKACTEADLDTDAGFATFAKVSFDLKKYADAIWGYTKALELNPNLPEAEFNLANTYFVADNYAEAEPLYKHLLQRMPQDFRLHFNLGETCAATGRYQEALGYYNSIPKNHPQLAATDLRIVNCYGKMGNHTQAHALLEDIARNPQMPDQLKNAARMMLAGGATQQQRST
jgi:tetratricopeptide (TPR) repeat protein